MYRYDGLLLAECRDEDGLIEVIDKDGVRYLHFGSPAQQSSMTLANPGELRVPYERAMMSCLLFNPAPRNALVIGLGGGSLTRFLLDHCDHIRLQVVEKRARVVEVAQRYFAVEPDARLQINVGCGAQYVAARQSGLQRYDLILVDAYHGGGMALEVASEAFFQHCHDLLGDNGMLVINLWRSDKALLVAVTQSLLALFQRRAYLIPEPVHGNVIAMAFALTAPRYSLADVEAAARQLQQQTQLDLAQYVRDLKGSDLTQTLFIDD
jgi:spermidine synthase